MIRALALALTLASCTAGELAFAHKLTCDAARVVCAACSSGSETTP